MFLPSYYRKCKKKKKKTNASGVSKVENLYMFLSLQHLHMNKSNGGVLNRESLSTSFCSWLPDAQPQSLELVA